MNPHEINEWIKEISKEVKGQNERSDFIRRLMELPVDDDEKVKWKYIKELIEELQREK